MTPIQYQLSKTTAQLIEVANKHFQQSFPIPKIEVDMRGKAAGKALLQLNTIKLNKVLFAENQQAFIDEVLPHELAHLITHQVFGRVRPHGKEWQYVMAKVFGIKPERTHTMDVSSVQGKTFEYQCGCRSYPLSIRRHNKVLRGESQYTCRSCGNGLTFTGKQLS
ncbi:SprT family zinc-dependent metalloprotease [Vibrio breoganii]|uniref:SprT family zinc-dependent metalloprotease n=1 Tax=Vibrio breoganii TaxID=553239 RepID=UPI000C814974|nr:SprT family zinc-dependent metalloprotease [Vibrio breoganii]PMJ48069.1 SprT family protein [Vibrio breoganii]PMK57657.1 SprT family protein [Vibrio breoganii]PMO27121.1 SprT family protein [Vibrio breoganii]PMO30974.1 SprT family protein [Vibrio breoganii]PMO63545.1 SprT family protein [Vibrio breoganii]